MKPSIQLGFKQQLAITPQLQQAIRLLQLSTLDLQAEIQEALESNPLLDSEAETFEPEQQNSSSEKAADTAEAVSSEEIPQELATDSSWEDVYDSPYPNSTAPPQQEEFDLYANRSSEINLHEHLNWQLNLTPLSQRDQAIAVSIIDGIDDSGYLRLNNENLIDTIGLGDIEADEVEAVIHRIQQFDPPGVCARDARESILIQLRQLADETAGKDIAIRLCEQYFDLLSHVNLTQIKRKMRLSEDNLNQAINLIRSLNPYPGSAVSQSVAEYVTPDVIVSKHKQGWRVDLNPETAPKLRINDTYARLIKRADQSDQNIYLKNNLNDAKWFIKSLNNRHETLLRVAQRIVQLQRGFFDYGAEAMKPLVLRDIAEALELHESTVSRATTQKYMLTPRGTFEFKYFFSSHVGTSAGGECSATAIQALLKKLVSAESPKKPLSDNKLSQILAGEGIEVARRTVAKYREAIGIPSSSERKRLV
ncbi:MAG: RNA polymerase factor sigma-54 [gamma proteobacterium symbiont of Bathyaustriella thionipta]|nr:RNA polymerase factor sigma-54 [gamma proteobacterium symbiont of Bathyaustriella thionipta]